jgi:hypothetical protein
MRDHHAVVGAIAKQQKLKVIVSGLLVYGSMACQQIRGGCGGPPRAIAHIGFLFSGLVDVD